jgi:hypothetical protein
MAGPKRPRSADHDPPRRSSRVRTSTQQTTLPPPSKAKSSAAKKATSSRPTQSTSARGKSSIIPTPTETPTETRSITTSEHHGDGPQDTSDAGNSHGRSNTLNDRELAREALKIVNNTNSAELMILELMHKYSFSFTRLKELLRGKLSQSRPFCHTKSLLGLTTD